MLPPYVYEEARQTATDHVQVDVVRVARPATSPDNPRGDRGLCRVDGRVAQVFRGRLRIGEAVSFDVSCATRDADLPAGGTIWTDMQALATARALEGFFNREGGRLTVARDQVQIVPSVRATPYCGPPDGECAVPAPPKKASTANPLSSWWSGLFHRR